MHEFPEFMRSAANAVKHTSRAGGMEGYVWDGADGSQVVLWHCRDGGRSEMHVHDFDEYALVVSGTCVSKVGDKTVTLQPGDECYIPAGVPHDSIYSADYRAIDAFGARRVEREQA